MAGMKDLRIKVLLVNAKSVKSFVLEILGLPDNISELYCVTMVTLLQ